MKSGFVLLFGMAMLVCIGQSKAGVVIEGTRLIYDAEKKESSITVRNPDKGPYLIQSWIDAGENNQQKAPFVITPPLFRLESGKNNVLRVVRTGGAFPDDRESLFWLNIKAIPSVEKNDDANVLYIAIKSRMKLIYRPSSLKNPDLAEAGKKLQWQRIGNQLQVTNPTPHFINFRLVSANGKKIRNVDYVAPFASSLYELPIGEGKGKVSWKIINDYGGTEDAVTTSF
jgi:fimbrial chaperone protein